MSPNAPNTRHFAIGFFTAAQLEARDRATLARASRNEPVRPIDNAIRGVHVTVWDVETDTESLEVALNQVGAAVQGSGGAAGAGSFVLERFDPTQFPGNATPEQAFKAFLASDEGIGLFGEATSVQLFSLDIDAADSSANG